MYRVAGACFSLDDIEHGILRANALPHGRRAEPRFASGDARQLYSPPTCDARVHFALNCGARSCPPIRIYPAAHLDDELGLAARAFVESEVDVPSAADRPSRVRFSTARWYASDFGATDADVVATLPATCRSIAARRRPWRRARSRGCGGRRPRARVQ